MNYVYLILLIAAMGVIEFLIGGTRLLFSLPAYGILALASCLTLVFSRRIRFVPNLGCLISSALFFAYILVRASHSPVEYLAWTDFYMVLGCLMVYLLTAFYITGNRERIWFIFFLLLLGVAVPNFWIGAIQFTKANEYMLFGFIRNYGFRASGLYICPNHYAGFLESVAVLALSLACWSRLKLWMKILLGYLALCCYAGLALSASRGGYFSALFSLIIFVVLSLRAIRQLDRQKFIKGAVVFVLGAALLIGTTVYLVSHSREVQGRMNLLITKDIRIYNWQATLDQIRVNPIFGTGAGTHLYYGRLFRRPQLQSDPVHAHSDYLELLAEYGVLGGLGLVVFLWFHVANGFRTTSWVIRKRLLPSYESQSDTLALNIGSLSAIAGLAIHSFVDFNMHIPGNALLFAFIFGLLANPGFDPSDQGQRATKIAGLFRFALPALGIWMLVSGIPKLPGEYFTERARVALRDKDFAGAIVEAQKALGQVPPDAEWPEKSIRIFGGQKLNPDVYFYLGEANRVIGFSLLSSGGKYGASFLANTNLEKAVKAYRLGLAIAPHDEHILVRLGETLDGLKRFDEAEDAFQRAIKADPNLQVIYSYYAAHLEAMGKTEEAKAARKKAQNLSYEAVSPTNLFELGF